MYLCIKFLILTILHSMRMIVFSKCCFWIHFSNVFIFWILATKSVIEYWMDKLEGNSSWKRRYALVLVASRISSSSLILPSNSCSTCSPKSEEFWAILHDHVGLFVTLKTMSRELNKLIWWYWYRNNVHKFVISSDINGMFWKSLIIRNFQLASAGFRYRVCANLWTHRHKMQRPNIESLFPKKDEVWFFFYYFFKRNFFARWYS